MKKVIEDAVVSNATAKKRERKPMYNHDMAHCGEHGCALSDKCYRYWLGTQLVAHGWTTALFLNKTGVGCEYFLDIDNY